MDVKQINPALSSAINILTTMAGISPEIGKPSIKSDQSTTAVVTGIIDLTGNDTRGSLAISFSKPVALEIAKNMLGDEISEINGEIEDMVGEITNMMAGGAKVLYQEQGLDFDMDTPVVISGENHQINHNIEGTTILMPFTTNAGDFFIEACFQN